MRCDLHDVLCAVQAITSDGPALPRGYGSTKAGPFGQAACPRLDEQGADNVQGALESAIPCNHGDCAADLCLAFSSYNAVRTNVCFAGKYVQEQQLAGFPIGGDDSQ